MTVSYFKTESKINNNKEVKQIMDNKQLINNIIYKLKLLKEKQEKRVKNAS
jgi:hypothetical protein